MKRRIALAAAAGLAVAGLTACSSADAASRNISRAAEEFEIERRVVFLNGITDEYLLSIEGRCSTENEGDQLTVTCKTGDDEFKKHFLGLSDNVTYFTEQLDAIDVDTYHYRVIFKPETIVPDIDLKISGQEAAE